MTEYLRVERPDDSDVPVVVSVPHAGELVPDDVPGAMALEDRILKRDLDLYTDEIWEAAPQTGATLVASRVSRYIVDLNRAADDISPRTVKGGRRMTKPGYYQERGVVWRTATDGTPVMSRPMTPEEFAERIERFWTPYHNAIAQEVERLRKKFGYCVLLDGHSMPSIGRGSRGRGGERRADIVPGDAEGASCDSALRDTVMRYFLRQGYSVAPNAPYKGGWITRNYGQPSDGVHAIQIEVNRDLYMDEKTFQRRPDGLQRIAADCVGLIERVAGLSL